MLAVTEINCYQLICWRLPCSLAELAQGTKKAKFLTCKNSVWGNDISVSQAFLNWDIISALTTTKPLKTIPTLYLQSRNFFRRITQCCGWRAKHYSFIFISLTSSLPTVFSTSWSQTHLTKHVLVRPSLYNTFFSSAHKCDYRGHQPQMSHPVPLSVKCSSTLSASGQLHHVHSRHSAHFYKNTRTSKDKGTLHFPHCKYVLTEDECILSHL